MDQQEEQYIVGKVVAIFFSNAQNFYKVMKVAIEETNILYDDDEIVIVGHFGRIQDKETYTFYGNLTEHAKYGVQFAASRYEDMQPSSEEAIVTYLSSSKFKGIGPKTAEKIVDILGVNVLDLILDDPDHLKEVPYLNQEKRDRIVEVIHAERGIQKAILQLNQYGISSELAYRIYSFYEEKTLSVIQTNPYQLIYDIQSIGFNKADQIAFEIGIKPDAKERLFAGVVHTLTEKTHSEGDTYIEAEDLMRETISTLEASQSFMIDPDYLADCLIEMVDLQMVIQDDRNFYLPSLYASEWGIVSAIERIKRGDLDPLDEEDLEEELQDIEADFAIHYGQSQKDAILKAIQAPVFILTGGPGTGKTTVLNGLIQLFAKVHDLSLDPNDYANAAYPILMAAPTGRAAKRMNETTGLPASTIHRLLGLTADQEEMDATTKLEGKLLIIDEMSMVDTWLGYQLLKSVPTDMQVVLVGDKDQLPSVGPGQVLKDLIESQTIEQVELQEIYRQGDQSSIIPLAHHIKHNQLPKDLLQKQRDRSFLPSPPNQIVTIISQVVNNAISKGFTADDIQVLAPMYRGQAGINRLNKVIQDLMNPAEPGKKEVNHLETTYRINDKVLNQVNDPERNVFNGDIGKIVGIIKAKESDLKTDELIIDFDGNEVTYSRNEWNKISLSYCSSIHKSQGSEYKMVILPLTFEYSRMLRKDLLYTAVTRASDYLILLGQLEAFERCLTTGIDLRKTSLKDRLISGTEDGFTELAEPSGDDSVNDIDLADEDEAREEEGQKILTPHLVQSLQIDPMIGMASISPYDL